MVDRFEKQPFEEMVISSDFKRNMGVGEVVSSQTVTATDKDGTDSTSIVTSQATIINDGATKVSVRVKGGDPAKSPYKITFRCITSRSNAWEHDIQMKVENK